MYCSLIDLKLAPSATYNVSQWFLKWAQECLRELVMRLSIAILLYTDQLWTAKLGRTYILGRCSSNACMVCSSPIAVISAAQSGAASWDQSLAEFCLSLWLMELISSWIEPAIMRESSCSTSWITWFYSLALKRSLRMDLSGNCSWSEEQMIWMGEFQIGLLSTSGRLRNCWLLHAGLPEFRSSSLSSSLSFSSFLAASPLPAPPCCLCSSRYLPYLRASLAGFSDTHPMLIIFQSGFYRSMQSQQVGVGEKYLRKELLGNGGFAKCYLMVSVRTGERLAGKVIRRRELRDKESRAKVMQESEIHRTLAHRNIVQLREAFEWEGEYFMIMELCQNNSLKEFLRSRVRVTELEAKYYLLQMLDALEYLHASGIVHRDVKLGNVFLNSKMEVKLGDFGLSTRVKTARERRYTTCGTPNYIAPEILSETGHSFEVDIWAVGIMLYALLVGKPPFESETVDETYRRIKDNHYDFPKQIPLSNQAKQLIKVLLDPNPKTRISIPQIRSCEFLTAQKIPPSMPPYTISLPPQSSFLKQYGSEKGAKLAIYPRKVSATLGGEDFHSSNAQLKHRPKLSRVLSCDKDLFKLSESRGSGRRDQSELNRGVIFNTRMRNQLQQSRPALAPSPSPRSSRHEQDGNEVICYYDMSAKYGMGYLLSNGNFGVVFNDQTSLTSLADDCWLYYDRQPLRLSLLPESLRKKAEILRLCREKLGGYGEKNVLIPFASEVHAMSFVRSREMFVLKLSNGVLQFFWGCDVLTLRGFRWLRWRVGREEGECALNSSAFPSLVEDKVAVVREFLHRESEKKRKRKPL